MPVSLRSITPKRVAIINPTATKFRLRKGMVDYLNRVKEELQRGYQKVPPSGRYNRTRDLFNSFEIDVASDGSEGTLSNSSEHAVFAIGPKGGGRGPGERQARAMGRKGWPSVTDVARNTRKEFTEIVNRSIGPHAGDLE